MAISAKDVMALRKATGLGMMESKAALEEAGGDMQAAQDLLRSKGLAKMDGRSDRESAEGKVAVAVSPDSKHISVSEACAGPGNDDMTDGPCPAAHLSQAEANVNRPGLDLEQALTARANAQVSSNMPVSTSHDGGPF